MLLSKLQGVEHCSHCAGNKAELFTGLRPALGMEEMPLRFRVISAQPLESSPRRDRYQMKMRGGRAAYLVWFAALIPPHCSPMQIRRVF